jgi:transcription termination/antitermination protein NusG
MAKKTKETIEQDQEAQSEAPQSEVVPASKGSSDARWYIVSSSSGKESKTAQLIKQRVKANDFDELIPEVIVPTQEKIIIKRGKKQTIEERIFPGYILIKMVANDDTLHLIRNTEGVLGFVGTTTISKKPSPLNEKEVEGILAFSRIKQSPIFDTKFSINDAVKVTDGPFKDFVGTVQDINESKGQVTVLLSIFDRETPVQLDFLQITKI